MRANSKPTRSRVLAVLGMILSAGAVAEAAASAGQSPATDLAAAPEARDEAQTVQNYGRLPLSFEANRGQTDGQVKFVSRGNGYSVYLTDRAAILALTRANRLAHLGSADEIRMELRGANRDRPITGAEQLPGFANYFIGRDPAEWRRNVPTYARVRYSRVYPGVDLEYYGNQGRLEYDFIVAPGADPSAIELQFAGARHIGLAADGDLTVAATHGQIAFLKPIIYQQANGRRQRISGRFVLRDDHRIGFSLGHYDRSKSLIIDPVLVYSTYLGGGNFDSVRAMAVDRDGNAYVAGDTDSADFPVTQGAFDTKYHNPDNLFVTFVSKLNRSGTRLLYSTYLGSGACYSMPLLDDGLDPVPQIGLAVDGGGNAYIAGSVCSGEFPVTKGAFQTTIPAGGAPAFVAKLNSTGDELLYATYLGGSGSESGGDAATALAVDGDGHAFVTGYTSSSNFPVTTAAFQTHLRAGPNQNAFVTKLNAAGSDLVYSTYLGGSGVLGIGGDSANAIALDREGNAYVAGVTFSRDFPVTKGAFQTTNRGINSQLSGGNAFVTKLNATGTALVYSSYLGGNPATNPGGVRWDAVNALAVDGSGSAYVAGSAVSRDFPVTPGAFQRKNRAAGVGQYPGNNGFVTKFDPTGDALIYSTFLGGGGVGPGTDGVGGDAINSIALDLAGHAYVTGITSSADFPVTHHAFQTASPVVNFGVSGFVTELDGAGTGLVTSTYLGGAGVDYGNALWVERSGIVYVSGNATSLDFPVSDDSYQKSNRGYSNAFITKLDLRAPTTTPFTTLSSSANPQTAGQPVTFTATVACAAPDEDGVSGCVPAGSIEFLFFPAENEPFAVRARLDAAGTAHYTTATLPVGSYTVVASYSVLSAGFGPSRSAPLTETIQSPRNTTRP